MSYFNFTSTEPTLRQTVNLLKLYNELRWAVIWRDALGLHIRWHIWDARIVGELKWAKWKYET